MFWKCKEFLTFQLNFSKVKCQTVAFRGHFKYFKQFKLDYLNYLI
jgi:hypothetical protein